VITPTYLRPGFKGETDKIFRKTVAIGSIKPKWENHYILWSLPFQTVNPKERATYIIVFAEMLRK
jgi:hypothetical protein